MAPLLWHVRDRVLEVRRRPLVMGIVNVTPDSFSDGGRYHDPAAAVELGLKLVAQGADVLDVGGESSRPGAAPVSAEEELRRVAPVVALLATRTAVPISVDTMKAEVARRCLEAGASIVNDVSGFGDPAMLAAAADYRAGVVVMHMRGTPATMQDDPQYQDVVREVGEFFEDRLHSLPKMGIAKESVCLDPGIGFGKRLEHNLDLLANLGAFRRFGRPLCLGVSRKGFIGTVCGRGVEDRAPGSLAVACFAAARGDAQVLRVHDVAPTRDAAQLLDAIDRYRR
ncbi:MAG: folP [Gemmataceae bacterium]|nr:folP [Gemmataceae bacterium]